MMTVTSAKLLTRRCYDTVRTSAHEHATKMQKQLYMKQKTTVIQGKTIFM